MFSRRSCQPFARSVVNFCWTPSHLRSAFAGTCAGLRSAAQSRYTLRSPPLSVIVHPLGCSLRQRVSLASDRLITAIANLEEEHGAPLVVPIRLKLRLARHSRVLEVLRVERCDNGCTLRVSGLSDASDEDVRGIV